MSISHDEFEPVGSIPGSPPLGWRLSMRLCNLLIAATIVGFALFALLELRLAELF